MSTVPSSEIAYRLLRLEQQLDAYQRLHAEELEQMRRALAELKKRVLEMKTGSESETTIPTPPEPD